MQPKRMLLLIVPFKISSSKNLPKFHTHTTSPPPAPMGNAAAGKVILSNGAVFTYGQPLTVAELMLEHPQEVVVEFQAATSGKKPTPLPADQKLETKKIYLMVPIRRGKPATTLISSSEETRKLLAKTNYVLRSKALLSYYTGALPLFARICPGVGTKNGVVLMVDKKRCCLAGDRIEEGKDGIESDYFTEILEGRPEFLSRQISGKGWKPSLDTIKEKTIKAKVSHWLF